MIDLEQINDIARNATMGKSSIIVNKSEIEMILETRIKMGEAVEDFFLVIPAEEDSETEIELKLNFPFWNNKLSALYQDGTTVNEDRVIKMKVFMDKSCPKAAVCNKRLMDYPKLSNPSPIAGLNGHTREIFH